MLTLTNHAAEAINELVARSPRGWIANLQPTVF